MSHSPVNADVPTTQNPEQSPSRAVIEAVAEAEGVDPLELDPLYAAIDPDALDSIFQRCSSIGDGADPLGVVRFEYQGYRIRVTATGEVTLDELQG